VKTIDRAPSVQRRCDEAESFRCVTTSAWPVICEDFSAGTEYRLHPHSHEHPHVCFVIEGVLNERDRRRWRRLSAGAGRLSPPGDMHHLSIGDSQPLRCLILSIDAESLGESGKHVADARRYVTGPGVSELASRLLCELGSLDDASPISLEMLGLEAAALTDGAPGPRIDALPSWLERVRDRVRDDLRSVPTLEELARDAGVSRSHLARTFRARYGYTIGQFVRGQRLETARRLVLRTDLPLATVAYQVGFADQSHMTRLFGSRFGQPPGRLRARRFA
jgi:AraC family transcriptional regulator